jgi:hypothetical protein
LDDSGELTASQEIGAPFGAKPNLLRVFGATYLVTQGPDRFDVNRLLDGAVVESAAVLRLDVSFGVDDFIVFPTETGLGLAWTVSDPNARPEQIPYVYTMAEVPLAPLSSAFLVPLGSRLNERLAAAFSAGGEISFVVNNFLTGRSRSVNVSSGEFGTETAVPVAVTYPFSFRLVPRFRSALAIGIHTSNVGWRLFDTNTPGVFHHGDGLAGETGDGLIEFRGTPLVAVSHYRCTR